MSSDSFVLWSVLVHKDAQTESLANPTPTKSQIPT